VVLEVKVDLVDNLKRVKEIVAICWPEEKCDKKCVLERLGRLNEKALKPKVLLRTQEFPVSCNDLVVFVGVKGSNGEDDLVGHKDANDTRIKDRNARIEILDMRRYEIPQEDAMKDNLIGYKNFDDKEIMII